MKDYNIELSLEQIEKILKSKFKETVKESVEDACLQALEEEKENGIKRKEIIIQELKTQIYLRPGNNISTDEMRMIMHIRMR